MNPNSAAQRPKPSGGERRRSPATRDAPRGARRPLPFVFLNMSMTADGKIATADRSISSFSSRHDLDHLYELRATADAVMCGARTVNLNKISLGSGGARFCRLRLRHGLAEHPLRVIVTGSGSLRPRAHLFTRRFSPILLLTTGRADARRRRALHAVADAVKVCGREEIDFHAALVWLRERWGVRRLLCEGGGELNSALLAAGLVDELHLTVCPLIFGGGAAPTIADGLGVAHLADAAQLRLQSQRRKGDEIFLVFTRRTGRPGGA